MGPTAAILYLVLREAIFVYTLLILARVILSWVPDLGRRYPDAVRFLLRATDPALRPFQRVLSPYKTGGLDLSPILAIIALRIIEGVLARILIGLG